MRDLAKDLELCVAVSPDIASNVTILVSETVPLEKAEKYFSFLDQVIAGWPEAIRRAMEAEAELARKRNTTYCVFCGQEFSVTDMQGVNEHIRTCEKHPARQVEKENEQLREKLKAAEEVLTEALAAIRKEVKE